MKRFLSLFALIVIVFTFLLLTRPVSEKAMVNEVTDQELNPLELLTSRLQWWEPWQRPEGPPRIALQIGHENQQEVADELEAIRNNTGTTGGGFTEVQVNREIALRTKDILDQQGYEVVLLSANIPPRFWADVFVSIHADGSTDSSSSGFKVAAARIDVTGKAEQLESVLETTYAEYLPLAVDPNVTRNMRNYYAFNWRRYDHSLHPMTTATIIETGFLTNPADRAIIAKQPQLPAEAIAEGIRRFVTEHLKI